MRTQLAELALPAERTLDVGGASGAGGTERSARREFALNLAGHL